MNRSAMNPSGRRWRAYFAPVDRSTSTPTSFDPSLGASFSLHAPSAPWVSAGWIENFTRSAATEMVQLRTGARQALARQARRKLSAQVEFDFCDWGKLQMALSGGAEHMNVLAGAAEAVQPGSSATQLVVGAGAMANFALGDMVAVDIDYAGQTGYVGSGIAGAYVRSATDIGSSADYIRRVTFNVGRIAAKDATSLTLVHPLLGGAPTASAKIQKILGFTDREGGAFFQEWSGLFVFDNEAGGRVALCYPRLQPAAPAAESSLEIQSPLRALALHARFTALPFTDATDSEPALCWRTYYPASGSPAF